MRIVRVTIEGGVIQHVEVPPGVQVIVKDYDDEGTERDENGDKFNESTWENE